MYDKENQLVEILLATYNGGKYLKEQLDSIVSQTYSNWVIIARDDGSEDDTIEILEEYKKKYFSKFIIIKDSDKRLGVCQNFGRLMQHSTADYIMFCDQDDVWLKNKISHFMREMISLEKKNGSHTPILIFSDVFVVNEKLEILADSMLKYQNVNPNFTKDIKMLAVCNPITGCSTLLNKAAVQVSIPPVEVTVHDWWAGLSVLDKKGVIHYIDSPLVKYRQHASNAVGARRAAIITYLLKAVHCRRTLKSIIENYKMGRKLNIFSSPIGYLISKILSYKRILRKIK